MLAVPEWQTPVSLLAAAAAAAKRVSSAKSLSGELSMAPPPPPPRPAAPSAVPGDPVNHAAGVPELQHDAA